MAKILICDDAEFMRKTIRETLEAAGHEVAGEADDVDAGVEQYKKLRPDLVTMDMIMEHSGVDAIKQIKEFDPKAKIIVVSVFQEQEGDIVSAIRAGALGMVSKPIKREVLLEEIDRVLKL